MTNNIVRKQPKKKESEREREKEREREREREEERKKITTEKNEKEVVYFWKEKAIKKKISTCFYIYL